MLCLERPRWTHRDDIRNQGQSGWAESVLDKPLALVWVGEDFKVWLSHNFSLVRANCARDVISFEINREEGPVC